jgi:hypothetical protein
MKPTPPLEIINIPFGQILNNARQHPFYGIILPGTVQNPKCMPNSTGYTWAEVIPTPNGFFQALPQGRQGWLNQAQLFEINGIQGVVPGTIVEIEEGFFNQTCASQEYLFDYCCPAPVYGSGSYGGAQPLCCCPKGWFSFQDKPPPPHFLFHPFPPLPPNWVPPMTVFTNIPLAPANFPLYLIGVNPFTPPGQPGPQFVATWRNTYIDFNGFHHTVVFACTSPDGTPSACQTGGCAWWQQDFSLDGGYSALWCQGRLDQGPVAKCWDIPPYTSGGGDPTEAHDAFPFFVYMLNPPATQEIFNWVPAPWF